MAKAPETAPAYDPDLEYELQVSRPLQLGFFRYLPRDKIKARGAVLNRIVEQEGADAIRTATKL